jgi:hypothetical protein
MRPCGPSGSTRWPGCGTRICKSTLPSCRMSIIRRASPFARSRGHDGCEVISGARRNQWPRVAASIHGHLECSVWSPHQRSCMLKVPSDGGWQQRCDGTPVGLCHGDYPRYPQSTRKRQHHHRQKRNLDFPQPWLSTTSRWLADYSMWLGWLLLQDGWPAATCGLAGYSLEMAGGCSWWLG